jgi:3-hydroxyisobutyrate dehydrogenase-like beta-hydroxyacid dehydrogenase
MTTPPSVAAGSPPADTDVKAPVTVIGLGPMGQAIASTFLTAGHRVTLWNRTASRADYLVASGATLAATPAEAIAASPLVIVSLTDYQAMYSILAPVVDTTGDRALAGTTIVNLSSDTPDTTREAAAWADRHGARFVTGGVMVPAPMVGTTDSYVYYSGPEAVFDEHAPVLERLGTPRYLGEDPGLAQLLYQAQLTVFLTALSGVLQATSLVATAGVGAAEFVPDALATLGGIPAMLEGGAKIADQIDSGVHPGNLSTVEMMGATASHILGACEAAGIDLALPSAIKSHYDRALAAGHAGDNWTSLFEVVKRPPA